MTEYKAGTADFAVLGGQRAFETDLPVGQLNFPGWDRYVASMRGIFDRQYYTNHGPVVQELESRLEERLGVRNALTITNATVGLYLVMKGLELTGRVLLPAFTLIGTAQAVSWAGLRPVFCDVEPGTHQVSPATVERAMEDDVSAVIGVNLWGGSCDPLALEAWAAGRRIGVIFDSAHAFGCESESGVLGGFGRAEVFSLHATKIVSSGEGGFITTDDDELAEAVRNMRSNYGIRSPRDVGLTINARMAESQAAIALMSLDDFNENAARNAELRRVYLSGLSGVPGVTVCEPAGVTRSNEQYVVCEIDDKAFGMSRDDLLTVLQAEGVLARRYFVPGAHRTVPYSVDYPKYRDRLATTDAICRRVLQLPVGALITTAHAERVASVIRDAQAVGPALSAAIRSR